MSRLVRVALAIAIILGGQWVASQPDLYMPIFDAIREEVIMTNDAEIVEMQDDERWLVIIVEFPDDLSASGSDHSRANAMLMGSNSAATYFSEISGGRSTLTADIQSQIHTAHHNEAAYGRDSGGERDVGDESTGGPAGLVEEALTTTFDNLDMSPYDFDNDGWVDRLLVLHTGDAQEDGGNQDAIWSHYAPLSPGFSVGGKSIGAYTISSFSSGMGTMIHEMLHMFGAVDLYDVHSAIPSSDWSGVGAWDIMASGNWNGNGRTPALPTSGTLDLIGANDALDLPIGTLGAVENESYTILPHVASAGTVRIAIAPGEYIWMESRINQGFDRELPAHGLLVTHEDRYFADFEHNEVNRDPEHAYLKVIEGDGDESLNNGNDDDPGDVFTSGSFGADGIKIRDGHGRLVPWTVTVDSFDSSGTDITISHPGPSHAEIMPPRTPIRLLGHEIVPISFEAQQDCMPWSQVTSTDGRIVSLVGERMLTAGESESFSLTFSESATPGTTGFIEGTIGCGTENPSTDVKIGWSIVTNRLIPENMGGEVDVTEIVNLEHVLSFDGSGYSSYDIVLEGPLDRIATTANQQSLGQGSVISLEIDPNGLLAPGMLVNGKVQLYDEFGLAGEFNVSLQAEPPGNVGSAMMWLAEPANNIQLVSILMALWVISSGGKRKKKQPQEGMQVRRPGDQLLAQTRIEYVQNQLDEFGNPRL
ncbi:MAG: M6 family metalloprotease domain-containing protein [Candidatus Thalassarchaeaceae archaeon]|jgi:M6 family metalloprotease-like protein|nr:M6 family metalloprotease domain-containing protein [Candidatus Thalassarchaeaceae archaeon]